MLGLLFLFFNLGSGGVVPVLNACGMCEVEGNIIQCRGMKMTAVVSVEACPGSRLRTDSDLLVTELWGWPTQVQLTRTTLECSEMPPRTLAVLNGEKCNDGDFRTGTQTERNATSTTKRTPWWPVPFPVPVEENHFNTTNVTTSSTTTSSSTSISTTVRDTTTIMIAVTAGIQWNGTLVIITVGVTITVVGTIVTIRCRRRQRRPVQVQEVTSTSYQVPATPPISPRRRRRDQGSFESIELFVRQKED